MSATLNLFDLTVIGLTFIFVLIAFFRGFIREIFALLNWVITIALAYFLTPYAAKFVEHYSNNKLVINVASGSMVFVTVFIIMALSTNKLAKDFQEKMPHNIDRVLGVFFGFIKSLLIFGLVYSVTLNSYEALLGKREQTDDEEKVVVKKGHEFPDWLAQARCFDIIKIPGEMIDPLVKAMMDGVSKNLLDGKDLKINVEEKSDKNIDDIIEEGGALSDANAGIKNEEKADKKPAAKLDEKYNDTGYSKKEIEKMNHLIEIVE